MPSRYGLRRFARRTRKLRRESNQTHDASTAGTEQIELQPLVLPKKSTHQGQDSGTKRDDFRFHQSSKDLIKTVSVAAESADGFSILPERSTDRNSQSSSSVGLNSSRLPSLSDDTSSGISMSGPETPLYGEGQVPDQINATFTDSLPERQMRLTAIGLHLLDATSQSQRPLDRWLKANDDPWSTLLVSSRTSDRSSDVRSLTSAEKTSRLFITSNYLLRLLESWFGHEPNDSLLKEIRFRILLILYGQGSGGTTHVPSSGRAHGGQSRHRSDLQSGQSQHYQDPSGNPSSKMPFGTNLDSNSSSPRVGALTNIPKPNKALLRCHFYFRTSGAGAKCSTAWKNPRDLNRHLHSHGHFFCFECSHYLPGIANKPDFEQHHQKHKQGIQLPEFCADHQCLAPERHNLPHARSNQCFLKFQSIPTNERKWFSLFALLFPTATPPNSNAIWRDPDQVEIPMATDHMEYEELPEFRSPPVSVGDASSYPMTIDPLHLSSNSTSDHIDPALISRSGISAPQAFFDQAQPIDNHQSEANPYHASGMLPNCDLPTENFARQEVTQQMRSRLQELREDYMLRLTQDVDQNALHVNHERLDEIINMRVNEIIGDVARLFLTPDEMGRQEGQSVLPDYVNVEDVSATGVYKFQMSAMGYEDTGIELPLANLGYESLAKPISREEDCEVQECEMF